jgi:AhpD family alkylhydroperoxidase
MSPISRPRLDRGAKSFHGCVEMGRPPVERGVTTLIASTQSYRDFVRLIPDAAVLLNTSSLQAVEMLDPGLTALLDLRASQINGCLLCVQHHLFLARDVGVSDEKVEQVDAWRRASVFSPGEKAALSWAEYLAGVFRPSGPDSEWSALKGHFSNSQMARLFMYWHCSELWSGNDILRCCTARMPVNRGVTFRQPDPR